MKKRPLSRLEKKEILRRIKFKDFQINAVIETVFRRYSKVIEIETAINILRVVYFLDAKNTLNYLDRVYNKRQYYLDRKRERAERQQKIKKV